MTMRMVGMAKATIQVAVAAMARATILMAVMARATIVSLKSQLMIGSRHKKQTWSTMKTDCSEELTMMTRTWSMTMRMVGMAKATIQVAVAAMARATILMAIMARATIRKMIVFLKSQLMIGSQ